MRFFSCMLPTIWATFDFLVKRVAYKLFSFCRTPSVVSEHCRRGRRKQCLLAAQAWAHLISLKGGETPVSWERHKGPGLLASISVFKTRFTTIGNGVTFLQKCLEFQETLDNALRFTRNGLSSYSYIELQNLHIVLFTFFRGFFLQCSTTKVSADTLFRGIAS